MPTKLRKFSFWSDLDVPGVAVHQSLAILEVDIGVRVVLPRQPILEVLRDEDGLESSLIPTAAVYQLVDHCRWDGAGPGRRLPTG